MCCLNQESLADLQPGAEEGLQAVLGYWPKKPVGTEPWELEIVGLLKHVFFYKHFYVENHEICNACTVHILFFLWDGGTIANESAKAACQGVQGEAD